HWVSHPKTEQARALRARIILAAADGEANRVIASDLRVRRLTVVKWRARFLADRVDGLADGQRSGAQRKISDEAVEQAVRKTLTERPRDATHWKHPVAGQRNWHRPRDDSSDLARVRAPAASRGHVQALQGPGVNAEGTRHRRPLAQSTRSRPGAMRRREV